ncbi:MAG: hypothetical protein QY318_02415 [Candidatus Dojkabacteria bacterium]|nr:MAG: hypothetical protein QY318_02415 [Candidatus Dojkabacteria bacterium]
MKKLIIILGLVFGLFFITTVAAGSFAYFRYFVPAQTFAQGTETIQEVRQADANTVMDIKMKLISMEPGSEGETITLSMHVDMDMLLDTDNEKLYLKMLMDGESAYNGEEGTFPETKVEMYVIGEDLYLVDAGKVSTLDRSILGEDEATIFDFETTWQEITAETMYEFLGEEKVNGIDAYKYRVPIDATALESMFEQLNSSLSSFTKEDISFDDVSIDEINYFVWVSKDDAEPLREDVELKGFSVSIPGIAKFEYEEVDAVTLYNSVNKPVKIEAPE